MQHWVSLDFETRSRGSLARAGVYRYFENPSTEILCVAWAIDNERVQATTNLIECPAAIVEALERGALIRAWNAVFERLAWGRLGWTELPLERWVCSAALAARAGLPRSLEKAARFLGMREQKDMAGNRLMRKIAEPQKNGTWYEPAEDERMALLRYCAQDVQTEREVFRSLPPAGHPLERKIWLLDQRINARGVRIDFALVDALSTCSARIMQQINDTLRATTGGNVTAVTQLPRMKKWLSERGIDTNAGLDKNDIRDLLLRDGLLPEVREVLDARAEGNKSSMAKLDAMERMGDSEGYIRGLLLYYGARTGRWSGKGPQLQNLPRGGGVDIQEDHVAAVLANPSPDTLTGLFPGESPMGLLSAMLRGCVVPSEGHEFVGADYLQIEARILAWFAGADLLLDSLVRGRAYMDMCRIIFGREIDKKKEPTEYYIGKSAVLGCGFGMGGKPDKNGRSGFRDNVQKLTGIDIGASLAERTVDSYRLTHYQVPHLWRLLQRVAMATVANNSHTPIAGAPRGRLQMCMHGHWLTIQLPSGRKLWYPYARISRRTAPWIDKTTGVLAVVPCVTFQDSVTGGRNALYGGLLTENVVQATARDIMAEGMLRADAAGFRVVLSVHDEVIADVPAGTRTQEEFQRLLEVSPGWTDCPIKTSGWTGPRYKK